MPYRALLTLWRNLAGGAFVAVVSLVYATTLLASQLGYQPGQDSHYHFVVASEIRAGNFRSELAPRLPFTILSELPVDHYFGYHALLAPFAFIDNPLIAMKVATVVLFASVFLSFYVFLRARGVAYASVWALLPAAFSNQDWRYLQLRGGQWMVILSFALVHVAFFVEGATVRRLGLVLLGYVAMLSYQGALVLLPLQLSGTLALLLLRRGSMQRGQCFEPLYTVLGLALGLTLNPYMDGQGSTWKFAWFHVRYMLGDPANLYPDLREFGPMPLELLGQNPEFVVLPLAILVIAGYRLYRMARQDPLGFDEVVIGAVALASIILAARAIRLREYAVPWAFAFLAIEAPREVPRLWARGLCSVAFGLALLFMLRQRWFLTRLQLLGHLPTAQYENARPLLESYAGHPVLNIAEGDYTTLRWEDPHVVCVQGLSRYFLYPNRPVFDDVWTLRTSTDPVVRLQILKRFYARGVRLLAVQHRNAVFAFAERHTESLQLAFRSHFHGAVKIEGSSIYVLNEDGIASELSRLGAAAQKMR